MYGATDIFLTSESGARQRLVQGNAAGRGAELAAPAHRPSRPVSLHTGPAIIRSKTPCAPWRNGRGRKDSLRRRQQLRLRPVARGDAGRVAAYRSSPTRCCTTSARVASSTICCPSRYSSSRSPSSATRRSAMAAARAAMAGGVSHEIGTRHGKTPRQVALRFLTRDPALFAIPKASDVEHVEDNAGATNFHLSVDDIVAIDRAFPRPAPQSPTINRLNTTSARQHVSTSARQHVTRQHISTSAPPHLLMLLPLSTHPPRPYSLPPCHRVPRSNFLPDTSPIAAAPRLGCSKPGNHRHP